MNSDLSKSAFLESALAQESELSLEYLLGVHPGRYDDVVSKPALKGYWPRLLRLLYKSSRLIGAQRQHPCSVMFYAGTNNQLKTLLPVLKAHQGDNWRICARPGLHVPVGVSSFRYGYAYGEFLAGLWACLTRGARLHRNTKGPRKRSLIIAADRFFQVYFDLLAFRRILSESRPSLVVICNDHNPDTRSLMLTARMLNIPVAYLQHASVNDYFPPLTIDYAFLDGEAALECYQRAQNLRGKTPVRPVKVLLGGQKKPTASRTIHKDTELIVGLSLNRLDDLDQVEQFIQRCLNCRCQIVLRPHPGDTRRGRIASMANRYSKARYSDSRKEDIAAFLSGIDIQLATNSSIHLESVLAGTISYCCDFGGNYKGDHYGFLGAGLVDMFPVDAVASGETALQDLHKPVSARALATARHYSASLGTAWQGREGDLVARSIERIIAGGSLDKDGLYAPPKRIGDYQVYDLARNVE